MDLNREELRRLIRARGLKQKDFARRIGVTETHLSSILGGAFTSQVTLKRMAKALDVGPEALGPPGEADRLEQDLLDLFRQLSRLDKITCVAQVREFVEGRSAAKRVG